MQISIINSDRSFSKNELFSHDDQFNLLYPFFKLKNILHKKNIDINTSDISPPEFLTSYFSMKRLRKE